MQGQYSEGGGAAALPVLLRRRAARPVPVAAVADDWPRTGRLLPWLLAGFLVMLWLVPFDAINLPISVPFDMKLDRVLLVGIGGFWVASMLARGASTPRPRITPLHVALVLLFATSVLSVLVNLHTLAALNEISPALKALLLLFSYIVFFFIVVTVMRANELAAFSTLLVVLASITAIGTLYQYHTRYDAFFVWSDALLPGSVNLQFAYSGTDFMGRALTTGPTQHALALATILSLALPFALLGMSQASTLPRKFLYLVATGLLLAAAAATLRKTAALVPIGVLLVLLVYRPKLTLKLAPVVVLLIAAIPLVSPGALTALRDQLQPGGIEDQADVKSRSTDFPATAPDLRTKPAFGRGYGTYDPRKYRYLDNNWLGLAVGTGVLGVAAFAFVLLAIFLVAHPVIRSRDPARSPPALAAAAAAAGFGISMTLFDTLSFPQAPYIFLFIAAMAVVASRPAAVRGQQT